MENTFRKLSKIQALLANSNDGEMLNDVIKELVNTAYQDGFDAGAQAQKRQILDCMRSSIADDKPKRGKA